MAGGGGGGGNLPRLWVGIYCIVLYCFGSYPVLVMGVVPSLMGSVCVYVCSGQSKGAGGGHSHKIPYLRPYSMVYALSN